MSSWFGIPAIFFGLFGPAEIEPVRLDIETSNATISYSVELADNPFTQLKGLMHRESLGAGKGMLFTYETDRLVQFWMKNVSFPLNILFIDRCGAIVHIHENAKPQDPTVISSPRPVRAVLEIPGGASKRAQLRPGEHVRLLSDATVFDQCPSQSEK